MVSIIIPTLNEADNLPTLVRRIAAALPARPYEIIIVDDNSPDATRSVAVELALTYPVRLEVRENPRHGLSGAVLHGMAMAQGEILVVMDADLQHPPESIPDLLAVLETGQGDFALASRYVAGGSTDSQWGVLRKINSRGANLLARPLVGAMHDPMSGFFALRQETYARATHLAPLGYKIALELICKCQVQKVVEVPIHFGRRTRGESKLTMREQFRYLEHLSRLYDFSFPRLSPQLKFVIATATGWFLGLGMVMVMLFNGLEIIPAIWFGYAVTVFVTAVFHFRYVRTQREFIVSKHPWRSFAFISLLEWLACGISAWWLTRHLSQPTLNVVFVLSFGCATLVRYIMRKELLEDIRGLRRENVGAATPAAKSRRKILYSIAA